MDHRYDTRLPVRLLPRRGAQILPIVVFGFFLGFALFWMAGASGVLDLDEGTIHFPPPGGWADAAFSLLALPFAIGGLCGIAGALLKTMPGSPYHHLEISAEGLVIRTLFKQRRFPWRALPAFERLEHRRKTKNGTRTYWYTVSIENAPLEPGMEVGATHTREVLRIDANEYGAKDAEQDALDLATWLNELRALAVDNRLSAHEPVQVPAGFIANAVVVPGRPGAAGRTATVVRR